MPEPSKGARKPTATRQGEPESYTNQVSEPEEEHVDPNTLHPALSGMRPVEEWSAVRKTEGWVLAAARVLRSWVRGQMVTEEEYTAGTDAARGIQMK